MENNLIDQILDVEKQAANIVEKAKATARDIVTKAMNDADSFVKNTLDEEKAKSQTIIQKKEEELNDLIVSLNYEGETVVYDDDILSSYSEKIVKAVVEV